MIDRRAFLRASPLFLASGRAFAAAPLASEPPHTFLQNGAAPQNLATPLGYFDRLLTPTEAFFVRSHFGPPSLDANRKLTIEGLVKGPLAFTAEELRTRFKAATVTAVLQCAGNGRSFFVPRVPGVQWGNGAMGQATFTGVRLRDLLQAAGPSKEGTFVHLAGADAPPKPSVPAFIRSIPLVRAMDPSTLVAWAMNDEPLTLAHGAPLRLVVPGWAGDHWVKWLTHVKLHHEEAEGFYMQTAYKFPKQPVSPGSAVKPEDMRSVTTFPVKSVIARPSEGGKVNAGPVELAGCAFSGEAPIAKVEVSIDSGATWQLARLEGASETGRWQVWKRTIEAKVGHTTAMVRATDRKGNAQPEQPAWNPSGYFFNAWHTVSWEFL